MALNETTIVSKEKKRKGTRIVKKVKKNSGKIQKRGISKKNKEEKEKLDALYKLEIQNSKKRKYNKHKGGHAVNGERYDDSSSVDSDFLNSEYDDIKEISKQVKEQVNLYKLLLRTRILTQKCLCLSNKLPLLSFVSCNELVLNNHHNNICDDDNFNGNSDRSLNEVQNIEKKLKDDIGELLTVLHNFLKEYFIKVNIPVNEKLCNELNVICDEEDKSYYENRKKLYDEDTTESEKKLFSVIDTWFTYSKKMCLNFFDIMHKITKISSIKSLKTYEQPISSQVNQVMFDLPSIIENAYPQTINYNIIGEKLYTLLHSDGLDFNVNKFIYDDEVYYKKFLLNAIQNLKDNQEDSELLKSQREIYKIKKKYKQTVNKGKILSFEPIPQLVNFMLPEPNDGKTESAYDYMDNPEFVNVLLSSLFQD
ncbi:conserved Plasmodium protein, unknown function [Plasmodium ovale]|uniref:AATF leucine zipper-containing domain-containing protein n=2 Tax=Plasmodium ovale TaxID=36330 RepID=A0A1A8X0U1_PLAOA|nr:conserved Plasmodium protein, unknown function [Plasmodium ovale curtisi]SBS97294.1 conserved Plasmodium protein, unknown function [Plasmodium ovale curtisi]SCP05957.1 conserved Plasmodium protein, unknown function [Plasmodium ovale]